ncbi:MAG: hypothetical protein AB7H88_17115 [Vicinamibacterales bacterium]
MRRTLSCLVAALLLAAPAGAQQVTLHIQNGLVDLEAKAAPLRAILTEWGTVGGTRVVGADRVSGAPLTLTLEGVPEREALAIILRNVAGYMAAPRPGGAAAGGSSMYDRIIVLASSAAPSNPAPSPAAARGRAAGTQRFVPPRPPFARPQQADDDQDPAEEPDPYAAEPEDPSDNGARQVFTFPQPGQFAQPADGGMVTPPVITLQPDPNGGPPTVISVQPGEPVETAAPPDNGFQVIGSPAPGMIQPVPGQPTPGVTVPPRRPPG